MKVFFTVINGAFHAAPIAAEGVSVGTTFCTRTNSLPLAAGASNVCRIAASRWGMRFPGGAVVLDLIVVASVICVIAHSGARIPESLQ